MRKTSLAVLLCVFAAGPAMADLTVNIDFQPAGAATYTGVGMAADPGTYWNAMGTGAASNLLASDGSTATDIDVSTTYTQAYSNSGNNLLRDRLIWAPPTHEGTFDNPTINISGLDASLTYNIYIYAGYYGQTYRIDGVDKSLTGTGWNDNQPSWVEGTQYVSFLGVNPAGGNLDIDVFNVGIDTTPYGDSPSTVVSGMQIQAVPVPGAILLGMIGLSVVGVKLRKRA